MHKTKKVAENILQPLPNDKSTKSLDAEALNEVVKFVAALIINNDYIGNDDQTKSNSVLLKHFCIEFLFTCDQLLEISLILNESFPKPRSLNLINLHNFNIVV